MDFDDGEFYNLVVDPYWEKAEQKEFINYDSICGYISLNLSNEEYNLLTEDEKDELIEDNLFEMGYDITDIDIEEIRIRLDEQNKNIKRSKKRNEWNQKKFNS